MRAAIHTRYGGPEVLTIQEVPKPVPAHNEILVRVIASTVNRSDCGFRRPEPWFVRFFSGLFRPKHTVLGAEFAGVVEGAGHNVKKFIIGDEVFGYSDQNFGANAEYLVISADDNVARKPENLSFIEAASLCEGYILALSSWRRAGLTKDQKVVVYGASGSIGTAGVQIARIAGAHVTAVCNTMNIDVVKDLGSDRVVDYEQDLPALRRSSADPGTWDLVLGSDNDIFFDAVGKLSYDRVKDLITPTGIYLTTDLGPHWQNPWLMQRTKNSTGQKVLIGVPRFTPADIEELGRLASSGDFKPVVDRVYPLEEIVEATRYVETGQKTGNVVISMV